MPEDEGYITFGEIPDDIVPDAKLIEWAPLIPDNENPWSVRLQDIVIQEKKGKKNGRRRYSSLL